MNENTMIMNEEMNAIETANNAAEEIMNENIAHKSEVTCLIMASIKMTCKQIVKHVNKGNFRFDNIIQRSLVWEVSRKSELIHSLIEGYPVPNCYARRNKDTKEYDFLDAKQRLNAIAMFINNEYKLSELPEVRYEDENGDIVSIDITGMTFEELPEEIKDKILDYNLTICYFDDITEEQVAIMFRKLNNGKPLSTKDRNIASCKDIRRVANIGEHEIFSVILAETGQRNRNNIPMVMKTNEMITKEIMDISFESKKFNPIIQNTIISDEVAEKIKSIYDYAYGVWNCMSDMFTANQSKRLHNKMKQETHFISFIPFFMNALENNIDVRKFAEMFAEFFSGKNYRSISMIYNDACSCGAAKNTNIVERHEEIEKHYNVYMEKHKNDYVNDVKLSWVASDSEEEHEQEVEESDYNDSINAVDSIEVNTSEDESSEDEVETVEAEDVEEVEEHDGFAMIEDNETVFDVEVNEVSEDAEVDIEEQEYNNGSAMSDEMVELMSILDC